MPIIKFCTENRGDVFKFLKQKQQSIFLQGKQYTDDDVNMVRLIWGFKIVITQGKTDSKEMAILFNNNLKCEINT